MKTIPSLALGALLAVSAVAPVFAQAPQQLHMQIQGINWTNPQPGGFFDANVNIGIQGQTSPNTPWIQVAVKHIKTPEEATANLYDPVVAYLDALKKAADDLKHAPH